MPSQVETLPAAIGRRITSAIHRSPARSIAQFARLVDLDEKLLRRYRSGDVAIGIAPLVRIADVGDVTVQWLVTGDDSPPASYARWLEGPGAQSSRLERQYLRSLPLEGYRAPEHFWSHVLTFRQAVARAELVGSEAVALAREEMQRRGLSPG